ncbi:hypothetical protein [Halostella salina]|uniref:hypothetical protein n=1 Tax=Halostella salina TaxID=1547897 RepID=UPI000EF8145D|nr:hypothetical protein [Halostella salina]
MKRATVTEAAVTSILLGIVAIPVVLVTGDVYAGSLAGAVAVTVANVAYWKWREVRGDLVVDEHGTPWYVPGEDR